jgi:hypothetical protein
MDLTRAMQAAAAATKAAQSVPESEVRPDVVSERNREQYNSLRADGGAAQKSSGYGLPCAKCRLYYPANLDICPCCNHSERVSPSVVPAQSKAQAAAEVTPDTAALEEEREAFLKEFKSQLFAAHAEVASTGAGAPVACTTGEHSTQNPEPASICKQCYERLQERVDVCEAALHIDLKEATQIVYDAVWADSSDPSKTYTNAANALLTELRKRSGVSSLLGPFHPLGN